MSDVIVLSGLHVICFVSRPAEGRAIYVVLIGSDNVLIMNYFECLFVLIRKERGRSTHLLLKLKLTLHDLWRFAPTPANTERLL
ncbi:hypothetical protein JOB18_012253 [Solea senegalensis]|uniref:Uncharacterized protein n=1 Tax=Solea senegalensis TaxID=28829 RepID=A0AAV6QSR6_SOLSE|nr:hypothetical protein JOB18_012253 [Solea senegalensis]